MVQTQFALATHERSVVLFSNHQARNNAADPPFAPTVGMHAVLLFEASSALLELLVPGILVWPYIG
jgi:hypothetical protein